MFRPSRWYAVFATLSLICAAICGWFAWLLGAPANLAPASVAWMSVATLFGLTTVFSLVMLLRPHIHVDAQRLRVGRRTIHWAEVSSLETGRWITPLLLRLTLDDGSRCLILYSGDAGSCHRLLHLIGRNVRNATLDGIPYREVWGDQIPYLSGYDPANEDLLDLEGLQQGNAMDSDLLRNDSEQPEGNDSEPLLRPEDADEVERLYSA